MALRILSIDQDLWMRLCTSPMCRLFWHHIPCDVGTYKAVSVLDHVMLCFLQVSWIPGGKIGTWS